MRNFFKIMGVIIGATFLFAPNPVRAHSLSTTENGFYMMRTNADDLSEYRSVDSMCIGGKLS